MSTYLCGAFDRVIIMSRTFFRVGLHSMVCLMWYLSVRGVWLYVMVCLWRVSRVGGSARSRLAFRWYPAGKLQWRFICGFSLRHGLWLPFVAAFAVLGGVINGSCGNYGSFLAWGGPLRAVGEGGLWSVPKVESSAHARLAFRSLACWEASVTLHLWFRF